MSVADTTTVEPLTFEDRYGALPEALYARVAPTPVAQPRLIRLNRALATELGLDPDTLAAPAGVEILAGNHVPASANPLAMAYAGHQFGNWVPLLGDGRAVLLGDIADRRGHRRDIQLKGAGRTLFSRMGDGRAALGPVIREYVVSEGMAGLGIPTTRALAMVETGESVRRQRPEPGAVLTRVAASHVRVGTFQYCLGRGDHDSIRALADHVIAHHYPELKDAERPYLGLLEAVTHRTADLVAQWLLVGFIHGVMNTDNVSIAGETLDYGPCAFMDHYHPGTVFSSIDAQGRYAYDQQAHIGQWNLARLAECLLPLLGDDQEQAVADATEVLDGYVARFEAAHHDGLAAKIGLNERRDGDLDLANDLLRRMDDNDADFTLTFRRLADAVDGSGEAGVRALFRDPAAFDSWATQWRERLAADDLSDDTRRTAMRTVNPAYIPRNHRIQQVIDAAEAGDLQPLDELLTVVARPFEDHPELARYAAPPAPEEVVRRTFCGT
ncbi:protein adenylyltransferase SelO [Spectribacter hydrogenooxidans]|uniref:Protein nucleotidyltransferase YdiU n=1 Tax=Spectribacter hydrogenoxidans TaxID=3075608 RepID=A0ABU3BZ88_9GAMM|nr:YdiU family protein [Salinisphaera sp. W335]MDT0634614.1 YdiU family protein [Salinisphaera sp. W335]